MKIAGAKDLLVQCMQDPDSGIRLLAIRGLGNARYRPAVEPIKEAIYGPDFLAWDPKEKKEWFSALGQIGGNDVIPVFQRFLKQGSNAWFLRAVKEEMAVFAVEGLKKIATDKAMAVLVEAQRTSRKKIREASAQAVKGMTK
jgi:HEAT repeat protein